MRFIDVVIGLFGLAFEELHAGTVIYEEKFHGNSP
jgi:hypothetical protein